MATKTGAVSAVPPGPQGSPAVPPASPAPNAVADPIDTLFKGVLEGLQTDPKPAPGGDPDSDGNVVLSHDEEQDPPGGPAGAGEGEGEGSGDGAGEGDPGPQTVPLKRLNKEVARRKALEVSLEGLKAEVAALKGKPAEAPVAGGEPWSPLAGDQNYQAAVKTQRMAQAEVSVATSLLAKLDENPDEVAAHMTRAGFKLPPNASERVLASVLNGVIAKANGEAAEARAEIKVAERSAKASAEAARAEWVPITAQEFPWLDNEDDPRAAMAVNLAKHNPWVAQMPTGQFALAAIVERLHSMQLRKARGTAKPAAAGAPRVRPGAGGGGGGRVATATSAEAAGRAFQEDPGEASLVRAVLAGLG